MRKLALADAQTKTDIVAAEECLKEAFATDVRPALREWRKSKGVPEDPLRAFRESGYVARIAKERSARNLGSVATYA